MKKFNGKLTIAVLVLILGTLSANAQFFYGAKAGYLSSKLIGNDTYGGINWAGTPSLGLNFGVNLATDFNLHFDLVYATKGTNQKFIIKDYITGFLNDTTPTTKTVTKQHNNKLRLSYVQVPIYFKKSFSLKGGVFPYDRLISKTDIDFFVGTYVGYMIGSSANLSATRQETSDINGEITVGPTTDTASSFMMGQKASAMVVDDPTIAESTILAQMVGEARPDISELMKIDVGLNAGVGISVEISSDSKFYIETRASIGMLSIDKAYFNNYTYLLTETSNTEGNIVDINGVNYSYTKASSTVDLRNVNIGVYMGFIHYVGMIRQ